MNGHEPMLMSTEELAKRLDDARLRVFDVTAYADRTPSGIKARSGRADYEAAHIPRAAFIDLIHNLSNPDSPLLFTRPTLAQLEKELSRAGVSNEHQIVVYSQTDLMWATRSWWLLRAAGLATVAVLDGGMAKWRAEGQPLCSEPCGYEETRFRARPREQMWATKQEVLHAIEDGGVCTINALPREMHTGKTGLGYARDGHIKGSHNVAFPALLIPESGVLRSKDDLRQHFVETGALDKARAITYCGGGIAATLNAFVLVMLGHPNVAVYDGGLDEWSREQALPMEKGE